MQIFRIEQFKCFDAIDIPLNHLTVLCGGNGSGKSSVIQALLLYRSAVRQGSSLVRINGTFGLSLGSAANLICQQMDKSDDENRIRFGFVEHPAGVPDFVELDPGEGDEASLRHLDIITLPSKPKFDKKKRFFFTYLSAERIGPRLVQEQFSDEVLGLQSIGTKGQFTAECLSKYEREKIREQLRFQFRESIKGADVQLRQAVQDWMSTIVGPIDIQVRDNGNAPPSLYFRRRGALDDWVISTNTGFGITYVLPIIVAGLLASDGGMLIVDSPEAHLHPAAQTALAKFLAWVASSGVHVVIETHSDHIIDGLRVATISPQYRLKPTECSILNVSRDDDQRPKVEALEVKSNGSLSKWPKGFFDQQTINLRAIADAVRNRRGV